MLRWRLLLGALVIAILIGLGWLDHRASVPGLWLLPLTIIVATLATRELLDLAALAQLRPLRWTVYCGNALLVTGSWLLILLEVILRGWSPGDMFVFESDLMQLCSPPGILLAMGAGALLVVLGETRRYRQPGGNTANMAAGVFALVYVGLMLSFAVNLRLSCGVGALATWLIVVKMGDTGAYAAGYWFGRHKMAPLLSPGKTIEGAVGGLAFSCLGSWLAFECLVPFTTPGWVHVGQPWGWIVFGLLVGAAGMAGDLVESLLKRDVGVKDSSSWLPGFGGVLDMIDSLLLSAPVAWFCWMIGWVGRQ